VAAYSVRARDGAPGLDAAALGGSGGLRSPAHGRSVEAFAEHNIANAVARLDETGDLWSGKAWNPAELARALDRARKAWR